MIFVHRIDGIHRQNFIHNPIKASTAKTYFQPIPLVFRAVADITQKGKIFLFVA